MTKGSEVAVATDVRGRFPVLFSEDGGFAEVLRENFGDEGLSLFDLDRIKIPAGGGTAWEVPGLEESVMAREIEGIIVAWQSPRSYWSTPLGDGDEGGNPPDCASDEGVFGKGMYGPGSEGNPSGRCKECPMDEFGSDGTGKACKEQRLLFMLLEGGSLPVTVQLPPTSIKPLRKYLLRLASSGTPYYGVTTKLGLDRVTGKFTYSVVKPSLGSVLDESGRNAAKTYGDAIKALARQDDDATSNGN